MSSNVVNQVSYLRTSRNFPKEVNQLSVELDRSYIDIANSVNQRTIGIFPTNVSAITGNSYFFTTSRQQSLRQVYPFGAIAPGGSLSIPYTVSGFSQFVQIYGTCLTAQPDARPIPYVSSSTTAYIDLRVDTVGLNIIILNGPTAPAINSGMIVLEWVSN